MNWTGGKLQRHSKQGGSALINRQKQHFAKVRSNLQNGYVHHYPPFRPCFLRDDDEMLGSHLPAFSDRSTRHVGHSKTRQKKLDEYDSVAPVARRLSSMASRPVTVSRHQDSRLRQNSKSRLQATAADYGQPSVSARRSANREEHTLKKHSRRMRTSPREELSRTSRNRSRSQDHLTLEQLLEASKRKLLEHDDWVGLAPSRPVHMQFGSGREKERIGKRRKIESSMRERLGGERRRILTPVGDDRHDFRGPFMSGALPAEEDISIRIGTDALVSHHSTQLHTEQDVGIRPSLQSSDPMLLDVEHVAYDNAHDGHLSLHPVGSQKEDYSPRRHLSVSPSTREGTPSPTKRLSFQQQGVHNSLRPGDPEMYRTEHTGANPPEEVLEEQMSQLQSDPDATTDSHSQPLVIGVDPSFSGSQGAPVAARPFRLIFDSSSQNHQRNAGRRSGSAILAEWQRYRPHQGQPVNPKSTDEAPEPPVDDEPWRKFLALSADASSRVTHTNASRYGAGCDTEVEESDQDAPIDIDDCLRSLHATLGSSDAASAPPVQTTSMIAHESAPSIVYQKSSTETQQSPSASLRQITDLGQKPAMPSLAPDDGDDAWKKFVFGDVGSSRSDSAQEGSIGDTQRETHDKTQASSSQWSLVVGGRTSSDRRTHLSSQMAPWEPRLSSHDPVVSDQDEGYEPAAGEQLVSASLHNNAAQSEGSTSEGLSPGRPRQALKSTAATYNTSTQDEESSPDPLIVGNIHVGPKPTPSGRARPKKIVFTKPPAFVGHRSEKTLRIGSRQRDRKWQTTKGREESPSIYDIPVSDDIDEDAESIED